MLKGVGIGLFTTTSEHTKGTGYFVNKILVTKCHQRGAKMVSPLSGLAETKCLVA